MGEGSGLDLGTALSGASADVFAQMQPALAAGIPIALGVIAVVLGLRLFRRIAR